MNSSETGNTVREKREALLEKIRGHLTPERWEKILYHSTLRTRYISVILENIYYTQNMSAVIRTSDALGIQDLYLVGRKNNPRINAGVALGASNWTTIIKDNRRPVEEALSDIRKRGYRLVATLPGDSSVELKDLDLSRGRVALMFGQEISGLSETAVAMADETVTIPMYGFTESFNISVSAGICLYELRKQLQESDLPWQLSPEELFDLRYLWTRRSLKHADMIEQEYEHQLKHPNAQ